MDMKNITFIIRSLRLGGAERVLTEVCNYICNMYNITIITFHEEAQEYTLADNIKRINLELNCSLRDLPDEIKELKKIGMQTRPDLIISFDTLANLYSLMAFKNENVKVGIAERNAPKHVKLRIHTKMLRDVLYKYADFYIFQTNEASQYYSKIIKNNEYYIANPVMASIPYKSQKNNNEIIAIGRLTYQKNYPFLIDVFAEFNKAHKNYVLRIFGEGTDKPLLDELIKRKKIEDNVIFEGNITNIHKEISDAKIFVLCSHFEGIPNALLEAMAMGFPVVSIDCPVGGPKLLIQDSINGYLVKEGDKDTFVKRLNVLVENEEIANRLGNEALNVRNIFSIDNICNEWIEMLEKEMTL